MATITADHQDTVIILSPTTGIARVDQPSPRGGREIYTCAPQTLGRLLARLETGLEGAGGQEWIDLLGVSNPGIAVAYRGRGTQLLLAFGPRVKTVHNTRANARLNYHLPPTVWLQRYNQEGRLTSSYLWITPTKVTSVADPIQAMASPFGNVFSPRGNLCWGNVVTTPLKPHDPMACDNLFWGTDFNDHLVMPSLIENPATPGAGFRSFQAWTDYIQRHPDQALNVLWRNPDGGRVQQFATVVRNLVGGDNLVVED